MTADPQGERPSVVPDVADGPPAAHGWASWVVFAGVMLILVGLFHVVEGIAALAGASGHVARALVITDAGTWGWVHVALGICCGLVGLWLLAGIPLARFVAVVLVLLSAVSNLAYSGAFPIGSAVVIAVDVVVIYAIVVHGGELRAPSYR